MLRLYLFSAILVGYVSLFSQVSDQFVTVKGCIVGGVNAKIATNDSIYFTDENGNFVLTLDRYKDGDIAFTKPGCLGGVYPLEFIEKVQDSPFMNFKFKNNPLGYKLWDKPYSTIEKVCVDSSLKITLRIFDYGHDKGIFVQIELINVSPKFIIIPRIEDDNFVLYDIDHKLVERYHFNSFGDRGPGEGVIAPGDTVTWNHILNKYFILTSSEKFKELTIVLNVNLLGYRKFNESWIRYFHKVPNIMCFESDINATMTVKRK